MFVVFIDHDSHYVETHLNIEVVAFNICLRRPNQETLFVFVDSLFRFHKKRHPTRLNLHNHKLFAIHRNDVDLLVTANPVLFQNLIALRYQKVTGKLLAQSS